MPNVLLLFALFITSCEEEEAFSRVIYNHETITVTGKRKFIEPGEEVRFQSPTIADEYLWDFGDGNTSTNANPSHTYSKNGNYTVQLTTQRKEYVLKADTIIGSGNTCVTVGSRRIQTIELLAFPTHKYNGLKWDLMYDTIAATVAPDIIVQLWVTFIGTSPSHVQYNSVEFSDVMSVPQTSPVISKSSSEHHFKLMDAEWTIRLIDSDGYPDYYDLMGPSYKFNPYSQPTTKN